MADFIGFANASVLAQTYQNWQHIIIDDGSSDGTWKHLSEYMRDQRVEYYYQDNAGQTVAKNRGLKMAKGKYICFLDADNVWEPDKLQKQLELFSRISGDYKILYSEQLYIDGKGNRIFTPDIKRYSGNISAQLLFDNFVTFNTVMVDRVCFDLSGVFDTTLERSIDYELWLRFSTEYSFYYMADITTYYRIWEGQMSQDMEKRFSAASQIMSSFLERHPGLVTKKTINDAWGASYTSRGRYYAARREYRKSYSYYLKALRADPARLNTWKSILRTSLLWK